jgi:phospholipase C
VKKLRERVAAKTRTVRTQQCAANIVPLQQYFTDLQKGTLPAVALIESGRESGGAEHPDTNVQVGAQRAEEVINALMSSTSWSSSVFILTWDEAGGFTITCRPSLR